ncbi:MAG: cell surface protein SprA, partial [Calditrichaeota bacterium]
MNLKSVRVHLLLCVALILGVIVNAPAIGLKPPEHPPGVTPLFQKEYPGLSKYYADSTLLNMQFSRFKRQVRLDSSQKFLEIRELLYDKDYRLPAAMELDYYSQQKLKNDNQTAWRQTVVKNIGSQTTSGPGGIELNIPVRIKSKAFKRIFGGDRVGLRVTGNISFELAGRSESREGSAVSSYEQRGNFSPRFKQTQQFQVEGKVGDKVSVKVDQNSEATFDFENTLRLTYTGDEDEIIQTIEAGNVSLSLPSTNYVSASSKSQGLFGLKTAMQVGNFSFTGIASLQRGEKSKLTKTGGAAENTFPVRDYEYVRDRFFFVDDYYANLFESSYNTQTMQWIVQDPGKRIKQLDVWILANLQDATTREGWAVVDPNEVGNIDTLNYISGYQEQGYFKRLGESEYSYDEYRGYFRLNQTVNDNDIVAVSYVTDDSTKEGMLFNEVSDTSAVVLLKLIRAQGSKPSYPTWNLTMRNVYNLGASSISREGFDVNILYTKTGEDVDIQPVGDPQPFIYLMGLDRLDEQGSAIEGGDKKIDVNNGNIFNLAEGYLIFPSTTPFAPPANSEFAIDTSLYVDIYQIKDKQQELSEHKFTIQVTTSSVSSNFTLGFNVLEGSEIVKLNGRELQKDKDYTIDYFSGTLQILADEARRADANVEIEYERGSLFQLDKKTLLGGRMEYSFGDRGFIGATGLYLNKSTLDQRVRLGQEPVRNVIWDVNTSLSFTPNFITKALDFLPVVETGAESKLRIEAEYAEVNPNPNTFNEEDLGETKGVAYIDDFEGSKRTTPLGIMYRTWSRASVPSRFRIPNKGVDYEINRTNPEEMYRMDRSRVNMFWYNPYYQVPINDIWPNRDVNAQTGTTTNVLVMQWKNDTIPDSLAWAGIMRSTVNFPDQKKTKFIELWVKGEVGNVNIDLGKVSEDSYIREGTFTFDGRRSLGNLNTEDINLNGLLDDGEDVGLDGIPAGQPNADPFDNWAAPQETVPPFRQINGTEGNGNAQGAKYPDTEDLDGNGGLNLANEYFAYNFDLADPHHPYINGSTEKGWKLYRIPIRAYDPDLVVGNPDTTFQEIYYVRLWINDLPEDGNYHEIALATFDLVGNEWEETGVAASDTDPFVVDNEQFSITVYNTEENAQPPESYTSPPNVSGIRDRYTKAVSKEQSLVMRLKRLDPGARAEANKQLYEKMDLINYRKLKLFIHGDQRLPDDDSPLEFYLRFGPAEGIYYEIGGKVYPGWNERNHLDVVLDELAKTKSDEFLLGDSTAGFYYYRTNPDNPEQYFKVVGQPNLRNINFMVIGARNRGDIFLEDHEIWIDELRVTNVYRDKGTAMRVMTDLSMADVATFRAQWEVVDSDFRRIEDQFGSGSTTERQDYRMSLRLNKFLPSSWGFSIPVSGSFVRSRNIPKYFFNTDKLTNYKANGLSEKFEQFFGLSELSPELEENSRISETKSVGATISRQSGQQTPWYLKYSIDMLTLDMDWSRKEASDERNAMNNDENISSQLQLRIPFDRNNTFQPFGWLGDGPIVRLLSREKMYFTPTSFDASIAIRDNENIQKSRLQDTYNKRVSTTSSRRFSLAYNLFPSLTINFGRDFQSDAQLKGYRTAELVEAIFTEFDFGVDKVMN